MIYFMLKFNSNEILPDSLPLRGTAFGLISIIRFGSVLPGKTTEVRVKCFFFHIISNLRAIAVYLFVTLHVKSNITV